MKPYTASRLRKISRAIMRDADKFGMHSWCRCIGGWAVHLFATRFALNRHKTCRKVLGLTQGEAQRLFYLGQWPLTFSFSYNKARTKLSAAKVAVRRIEHFIKTKGRE